MITAAATTRRSATFALQRVELRVADAVGALMELWGFRRQLGRIWAVLFLSERRGDRKEHFEPETHVWRMVRRVLAERERKAVEGALAVFEEALAEVRSALAEVDPSVKATARHQTERLAQLVTLTRAALGILRVLLESARVDLGPLRILSEALSRPRVVGRTGSPGRGP